MRIGLNVFSLSLTDAPAVTAAAPERIITSGMRICCPFMSIHGNRFTSHVLLILYSVGQDMVSLQAFVAQVDGLVVGILIIQDEQVGILLLYGSIGSP